MKRLLLSFASLAFAATLGSGAALAESHHAMGHAMAAHPTRGHARHAYHRYGNDRARCRDAKGRFVKLTAGRCLAK